MQLEAINSRLKISPIDTKNRLFCRLDGLSPEVREQRRIAILKNLGLLEPEASPVFEEATQTAANFLEAPICILGLMVKDQLWLKSAFGLSRIGLMNQLAVNRTILRQDSFSAYVVDSHQDLILEDTIISQVFASSALVQHYGIRAYLGTPLMTQGHCIGALAVMDLEPRQFTNKDIQFLAMTARWCLREFERDRLVKNKPTNLIEPSSKQQLVSDRTESTWNNETGSDNIIVQPTVVSATDLSTNNIKARLLDKLTQKIRTPLTSVIGMASVLRRELYGPLTDKQKEYMTIIHNSGQYLMSLAEEIVNLGALDENPSQLQLAPIEIEMLCQQVLNNLLEIAKQQRQELRLSVEPGNRLWLLDKEKIRQALYYIVVGVLESADTGSLIRIHVSHRSNTLNLGIWASHPWLADGLPQVELFSPYLVNFLSLNSQSSREANFIDIEDRGLSDRVISASIVAKALQESEKVKSNSNENNSHKLLGLLLACHFVELHEGKIMIQGSPESGYRYILQLPKRPAG
ncbi:MAG: GAF domain-containing sensor histidine kinase [Prochloraceae cyanobacterium]|nr:GAF domain-containing sensor histidine kinase [Prochloraceae cyanobacterium]